MNLLDHVVGVAAQFDRVGLPVDPVDPRSDRSMLEMTDLEITIRQANDLAILQKRDPESVWRDRHRVASQQVLSLAQADDQRATKPRSHNLTGPAGTDDREPVRPRQT